MAGLFVSAAHKSSGKTTLTLGLAAALRAQGFTLQPFKKGPDYIDPLWLGLAAGRPCHNLDFYTMTAGEIRELYATQSQGADLALIEGNKGLYDGLDLDGSNSNAALAKLLQTPVLLVIDARGMTRGIAPLILGYQAFDRQICIAGVILNRLGGARHEAKLRAVIEHYTDVPVLGAVHQDPALAIVERHLGLMPSNEDRAAAAQVARIGAGIAAGVDLPAVMAIARRAPALDRPVAAADVCGSAVAATRVRIGIARDAAFGFYYPGDLWALEAAGAELVFFDSLRDARLPAVDGLFIGGGFPETQLDALQANAGLRAEIKSAIDGGLPAYAECGGLMYLAQSITWKERSAAMVGVLPARVVMHDRPQGRGYIRLRETGASPWPGAVAGQELCAHEFHYSALEGLPPGLNYAYTVLRGAGIDGQHDGIVYRNLLATYAHQRDVRHNPWAARFVRFVRDCRASQ